MSEDKIKRLKKVKETLSKDKVKIEETEESVTKIIDQAPELKKDLQRAKTTYGFVVSALNDTPEDKINQMGDPEFNKHIKPFEELCLASGTVANFQENMANTKDDFFVYGTAATALTTTTSGTVTAIYSETIAAPSLYPNRDSYIKKYQEADSTAQNIKTIETGLPGLSPDISTEFSEFVKKFRAHDSVESKSQELIALRSSMYFKLIFGFAESKGIKGRDKGGTYSRIQQISYFTTKNVNPPKIDEAQILIAKNLWDELSDQNPSGCSVKLGQTTLSYVEGLFNRCISILASLLIIRKKYFT